MSAVLFWLLAAAVLILPVMLRIWAGDDDPGSGREHQHADEPGDPAA